MTAVRRLQALAEALAHERELEAEHGRAAALRRGSLSVADVGSADTPRPDDREPEARPDETVRLVEAILFASQAPLTRDEIAGRLAAGADVGAALAELERAYASRGIHLMRIAGGWAFRTAADLAYGVAPSGPDVSQKLSRAATEVLAIVAYHQPVTRAEIEDIRGVSTSKGTLDTLLDTGWIRLRGRRRAPGRPVTFGTTRAFLDHFGLDAVSDLPGLEELKGLGLLDGRIPPDASVPLPSDADALAPDEEPLEPDLASIAPYGADE